MTSPKSDGSAEAPSLFLDRYWQIHAAWQHRLAADGCVDFEDMLVQVAGHLEAGSTSATT